MRKSLVTLLGIVLLSLAFGQGHEPIRIVVLGSSTAEGTGPRTADSAWVNRYQAYLKNLDSNYVVINLAKGGYTTYQIMPHGFVPPMGRPLPDTTRNLTKALNLHPDAIIVNLPSNDTARDFTIKEQLANFDSVFYIAGKDHVPIWITTTQPRNLSEAQCKTQRALRDSIWARYGKDAIDFWSGMAEEQGNIKARYDCGDGIHLNDAAHRILFERVVASRIHEMIRR